MGTDLSHMVPITFLSHISKIDVAEERLKFFCDFEGWAEATPAAETCLPGNLEGPSQSNLDHRTVAAVAEKDFVNEFSHTVRS